MNIKDLQTAKERNEKKIQNWSSAIEEKKKERLMVLEGADNYLKKDDITKYTEELKKAQGLEEEIKGIERLVNEFNEPEFSDEEIIVSCNKALEQESKALTDKIQKLEKAKAKLFKEMVEVLKARGNSNQIREDYVSFLADKRNESMIITLPQIEDDFGSFFDKQFEDSNISKLDFFVAGNHSVNIRFM